MMRFYSAFAERRMDGGYVDIVKPLQIENNLMRLTMLRARPQPEFQCALRPYVLRRDKRHDPQGPRRFKKVTVIIVSWKT